MIRALADHLGNPRLISAFAIGFCILFAFIGVFTYVNFVLARPPIGLGMMAIGFVYFVFLPSMFTTPAAGGFVRRFGSRITVSGRTCRRSRRPASADRAEPRAGRGGLMLVGVGTFFAQAAATGFVGRVAITNRGAASGLYLASYFSGGLVGTAAARPDLRSLRLASLRPRHRLCACGLDGLCDTDEFRNGGQIFSTLADTNHNPALPASNALDAAVGNS